MVWGVVGVWVYSWSCGDLRKSCYNSIIRAPQHVSGCLRIVCLHKVIQIGKTATCNCTAWSKNPASSSGFTFNPCLLSTVTESCFLKSRSRWVLWLCNFFICLCASAFSPWTKSMDSYLLHFTVLEKIHLNLCHRNERSNYWVQNNNLKFNFFLNIILQLVVSLS